MFISSLEMVYADDVEFCKAHLRVIKVLLGGVIAGVSAGRKLNSRAHADRASSVALSGCKWFFTVTAVFLHP